MANKNFVGAAHDFHDSAYVEDWANRFNPSENRVKFFETIIQLLQNNSKPVFSVVELGLGPGYFAHRLLSAMPDITLAGVDFSTSMIEMSKERLEGFEDRMVFVHADLLSDGWTGKIQKPVDAVVSTWALHDLGGERETENVYRAVKTILKPGGILVNGDFVKPDDTLEEYEPGRFTVGRHLEILSDIGFQNPRCELYMERVLSEAKPFHNYACLVANT